MFDKKRFKSFITWAVQYDEKDPSTYKGEGVHV